MICHAGSRSSEMGLSQDSAKPPEQAAAAGDEGQGQGGSLLARAARLVSKSP